MGDLGGPRFAFCSIAMSLGERGGLEDGGPASRFQAILPSLSVSSFLLSPWLEFGRHSPFSTTSVFFASLSSPVS